MLLLLLLVVLIVVVVVGTAVGVAALILCGMREICAEEKLCLCEKENSFVCPRVAYRFLRTICYRPAKQFCAILNRHIS